MNQMALMRFSFFLCLSDILADDGTKLTFHVALYNSSSKEGLKYLSFRVHSIISDLRTVSNTHILIYRG